jgi:hypothetical protein
LRERNFLTSKKAVQAPSLGPAARPPPKSQSIDDVATCASPRLTGRTEKNLCLHGPHRNAGKCSHRHKNANQPRTYSAEIRCNSRFPQIEQCAYSKWFSGNGRA